MPPHSWSLDPVRTLQRLSQGGIASGLAVHAVWAADALHYLAEVDDAAFSVARNLHGHHPDVVEIAHVRWAATSAVTAVDLGAASLGRLYCGVAGPHELSLRQLSSGGNKFPMLSASAQAWVLGIESDPDYAVVIAARNPLTHAFLGRDISLGSATHPSHPGRTAFAVFGRPDDPNDPAEVAAKKTVPTRALIETSRDFATRHLEAFLVEVNNGGIA